MNIRPTTNWIAQLLERDVKLSPRQSPDEIPAARELWDLSHLNQDLPELAQVHERVVLRTREQTDLTAEIYVPHGQGPFPVLLYIHGGSWCLWSAAHVRKLTMQIAAAGFVVVNLDYGLAPEHRFPWALEDSIFAAHWAMANVGQYNGLSNGLLIGGDSAGANLAAAAVVALAEQSIKPGYPYDAQAVKIAGALLLYGIFDFPLLFSEPGRNAGSGTIETTWNLAYLGPNFVGVHRNPLVSPAYWAGISAFPPSYLSCGARDALLPQTIRMTSVLTAAEVPTTASIVGEADHGFLMLTGKAEAATRELNNITRWLVETANSQLARY
ncbi:MULTISPECIES: alpha/beta hydrolase [unclassified Sinorhizobium]|uniref:alpha/beta hydrolase n=1 Tax=unclassified Sinorhizobium TaxID=2613772 RepID=UPI00352615E0